MMEKTLMKNYKWCLLEEFTIGIYAVSRRDLSFVDADFE